MVPDVVEKVVVFFEFDRTMIACSNPRHFMDSEIFHFSVIIIFYLMLIFESIVSGRRVYVIFFSKVKSVRNADLATN